MAGLQITIPNHFVDVGDVPVRIDIRDASLDLVKSMFVPFGEGTSMDVEPGFYVVEAELPSGKRMREAVKVGDLDTASVEMQTGGLSPHEFHAWAYLNKNVSSTSENKLGEALYEGAWVRLWRNDGDEWQVVDTELGASSTWDGDGVNYDLQSFGGTQFLQVGGSGVPWKLVALPGSQQLRVLIRPATGPAGEVHPLDVTVATHNSGAEAILSLLTSGAVDQAKEVAAAGVAEQMLYSKIADPAAAAIGGYFLLKIGDLDRLHDWTRNLANWIEWMPDGPIIRAWHVLKKARSSGTKKKKLHKTARALLLEAVERGIPIYTEGLRLLRDGVNLLSNDRGDAESQAAKAKVDAYTQACDWTAPTTTFLGASPAEPSAEPVFGKPDSMHGLAFLFSVDTEELIRQGVVNVGSTLSLDRFEDTAVEVHVEEGGGLNLDGKYYKTLQEVAASVGLPDTEQYEWHSSDSGESIYVGIDHLRRGKMAVFEK